MDNLYQTTKHFLLELLFPSFCFGCKKEGTFLCQDCKYLLGVLEFNYCLCDKPLRLPPGASNGKCGRCQHKKLAGLYFALPYQESSITRKLIYQFKYEPYVKSLSQTLAALIIEHLVLSKNNTNNIWENTILVPIPLENKKLKRRGYNQSEELAKELANVLKISVIPNNLVKIKRTESQTTLNAKARQENVKDAFAIKNPAEFAGKKVFLVDDVYTTGSTMEECAHVLRTLGGTKQVWGIALARESLKK